MIEVLPEAQRGEDGILSINATIIVTAILQPVKLSQSQEAVGFFGRWLWSEVAEQFLPIINRRVTISVQEQPGIVRAASRLGQQFSHSITVEIKSPPPAASVRSNPSALTSMIKCRSPDNLPGYPQVHIHLHLRLFEAVLYRVA